ncbi:MAG: protein kinase domain-containing protein [Christensenellales bacterium]|jgi:serine/threonine protein kinase
MKDFSQIERMCMNCHKQMAQPGGICEFCGFDNSAPKSPHHLTPRTILAGKFMVGRVLGEGGFGITYMGYDLNLDCRVAIKEYYPAGFVSRETTVRNTVTFLTGMDQDYYNAGMEKFLNEAKALAKFSELPGIARVRDFFRENGTAYIAMDYIEGTTLAEELRNRGGRLPADEVLRKMEPLIRSLSVVHNSGVIHRDISPDNIMQNLRGELKLLDFGAAKELASDQKSVAVMLKPGYAPEEQYRIRGEQGPWTDCYALCATIYKLITGVTPPEALERMAEDRLVPPSKLGADISHAVEQALLMGLAVKAENRFKSMQALYNAIYAEGVPVSAKAAADEGFAAAGQKTIPVPQIASPPKPQKAKKTPVGLIAGLGVLAVGVVVALVLLLKPNPGQQVTANTPNPAEAGIGEPSPTPSSFAGAFGTPAPTPEQTAVIPGVDGPVLGDGSIRLPDFEAFTGLMCEEERYGEDGSIIRRYRFDENALVAYLEVVYADGNLTVGETGEDHNLFAVQQGGAYLSFNYVDEMLEVVAPSAVNVSAYDPGVSYMYLCNNGLSYEQWLMLGNPYYNFGGMNFRGNTGANINNASCSAIQGEYLYYSDYTDTGYIYRMDPDTGEDEVILEQATYAMHMNAQGEYIYFTAYHSYGDDGYRSIYRCPTTPSGSLELLRDNATTPCVIGDYIYFRDTNDDSLRRMDKDGKNEILVASRCYRFIATGLGVFAVDIDGTGIFLIDHESLTSVQISDANVYQMILCGNYIYYTSADPDSEHLIFRIFIDGSGERELIGSVEATELNWDGEDIYFIGMYDACLYRVPMEGGTPIKMVEAAASPAALVGSDYVIVFYLSDNGMSLMAYNWSTQQGVYFP